MPPVTAWIRSFNAIADALLAALVFWLPNVVVHWLRGYRFTQLDATLLTFLLPAETILFFRAIWWPFRKQDRRSSQALFAVFGIWIAGPAMLTLSASFSGAGLSQPGAWHFFVFGTLLFPLFSLILSTYDGTLLALLLASVLLPALANFRAKGAATL